MLNANCNRKTLKKSMYSSQCLPLPRMNRARERSYENKQISANVSLCRSWEYSYSSLIVFSNFTIGRSLWRKGNEPMMLQCILLWFPFYSKLATPSSVFSFIHLHNLDRPHKYFTKFPPVSNQSSSPWLSQTEKASLHTTCTETEGGLQTRPLLVSYATF